MELCSSKRRSEKKIIRVSKRELKNCQKYKAKNKERFKRCQIETKNI